MSILKRNFYSGGAFLSILAALGIGSAVLCKKAVVQAGEYYGVHSIATDSKGNIYTGETNRCQRVQKFVYRGFAPLPRKTKVLCGPSQQANKRA